MTPSTRQTLLQAKRIIPPMLDTFHKGQLGRIAVMGGCEDYTGAPYFSAMASARLGCDMSHVICTPAAAAVIKTYSPNLMVHPLMRQEAASSAWADSAASEKDDHLSLSQRIMEAIRSRIHVLVVGPGLGRDHLMLDTAACVIRAAREMEMAIVVDADALILVGRSPELVRGYSAAVLTPNVVEFERLCKQLDVRGEGGERVEALAKALGGVTIIQKGFYDLISNGEQTVACDLPGGKKRSGGQGDTLTGAVATFLGWRKAYVNRLWEEEGRDPGDRLGETEMVHLAAFAGSAITRTCSRLAFEKRGRSLQASDLTDEVHTAFRALFDMGTEE